MADFLFGFWKRGTQRNAAQKFVLQELDYSGLIWSGPWGDTWLRSGSASLTPSTCMPLSAPSPAGVLLYELVRSGISAELYDGELGPDAEEAHGTKSGHEEDSRRS
jgi:hypothetical protein